jgi:hypothetical protein
VLGLLATGAAVVGSVRLGHRGPGSARRHALTVLANTALGLFTVAMLAELGAGEAADDYRPEYVTFTQPASGLRSDGVEISNIFAFDAHGEPLRDVYLVDQDGSPIVATYQDTPELEPRLPLDRDGNPVQNRYPQQQERLVPVDGGDMERRPVPAPRFTPPPGTVWPPPAPPTTGP